MVRIRSGIGSLNAAMVIYREDLPQAVVKNSRKILKKISKSIRYPQKIYKMNPILCAIY